MILHQNIELSWNKEARGGKMASVRNAIPEFFNISKENVSINPASCIWGMVRICTLSNDENDKFHSIFSSYEFEISEDKLLIFKPKGNGFREKMAELKNGDYFRIIKYWKSMSLEYYTVYHKSVVNIFFGDLPIADNHFSIYQPIQVLKE
jgi:hypothetical protein